MSLSKDPEKAREFLATVPGIADDMENAKVLIEGLSDASVLELVRLTSRFVMGQIFIESSEDLE